MPLDTPAPIWTASAIANLMARPLLDLVFDAQSVHRRHHAPNRIETAQLLSIKTGGCAEDCGYCAQSAKFAAATGLKAEKLMGVEAVRLAARDAKAKGAARFCMGAAWDRPKDRDLDALIAMIAAVREEGLETCMTLGMLDENQAHALAQAGLDYYNHNIDTSPEFYGQIVTTRSFQDRLDTLEQVRAAGMKTCCGGILGLGESRADRAAMLAVLANLPEPPQSVPINRLVRVAGTPLEGADDLDELEFVRTIAAARITMPKSMVRLSAGRETMSDALQALCFLAGANSVFMGDKLLTAPNAGDRDQALFERLGLTPL